MDTDLFWRKFLKDGDEQSFSLIYNRHIDKLYTYGVQLGYHDETCKDAIQDVFFKLFTSRENLKQVNNLGAYLFKSFKNRLIDIARKDSKTKNIDHHENESFRMEITILDDIIDAENAVSLKSKVDKLLSCLTPLQREAVYLRYMLELTYDEIAELLNINPESAYCVLLIKS